MTYPETTEPTRYEVRLLDEGGNDRLLGYSACKTKRAILEMACRPATNAHLRELYPTGETAWSGWQIVVTVDGAFRAAIGFSGRTQREAIGAGELPAFA
jgi:hypothetical protein